MFNFLKQAIINHLESEVNLKGLLVVYLVDLNIALFISQYFLGSRWPMVIGVHLVALFGLYGVYHNKQLKK
ncbi:hypothetical protein [Secundilactobacillus similis]|uniref:Uncharacterized protein n=1 Tax=Secundilactobacillus similis DSM 23365 = JCM 2765 TaxID=1423804 RepID=A0A0R2EPK4_9LACO|nr:hypothetical protein [Secundilactobacillus similis]KRN18238.1 hypothetical protein FD14_GL002102 [Secundilactobacillus similis DSM 23365 = JCM 2765]